MGTNINYGFSGGIGKRTRREPGICKILRVQVPSEAFAGIVQRLELQSSKLKMQVRVLLPAPRLSGGIGRRSGFRPRCLNRDMQVRVLPEAPYFFCPFRLSGALARFSALNRIGHAASIRAIEV